MSSDNETMARKLTCKCENYCIWQCISDVSTDKIPGPTKVTMTVRIATFFDEGRVVIERYGNDTYILQFVDRFDI